MSRECNKYESLFLFGNEEELNEHLKSCSYCQKEHDEMKQVSNLVKEIKPFINKKRKSNQLPLKMAACFLGLFITFFGITQYQNIDLTGNKQELTLLSVKENSVITQMGLPTDDYGLLTLE